MEITVVVEIVKQTGIVAGIIAFGKWVLSPIYTSYIQYNLDKANLHEKSLVDIQNKVISKKIEVETIKLNRALPGIEEINLQIANHQMMFNSYMDACVNNKGLRTGMEDMRVEVDKKIIAEIYKISIYLPPEMRLILNRIRKIVSCSWKDPLSMNRIIKSSIFNGEQIWLKASELYTSYHNCFYEMVYNYCCLEDTKLDYAKILENYGIDQKGVHKNQDLLVKFIYVYFLLPEYTNESDEILEEAFNE